MKKIVSIIFVLLLGIGLTQGQETKSLQDVIGDLKSERSLKKSNYHPDILIEEALCAHNFKDYEWLKVDANNFRIVSQEVDYQLQIMCRNGQLSGYALNKKEAFGYRITFDTEIHFTKVKKEELIFVCSGHDEGTHNEESHEQSRTKKAFGNSEQVTDPLQLQSRPGATNLIYLDFDGEPSPLLGMEEFTASNPNISDELIVRIWNAIADDFSPFDVNITTNRALYESHPSLQKGWLIAARFNQSWNGLANANSFGTGSPCLMDLPSSYDPDKIQHQFIFRTGSHELGHTVDLRHHGKAGNTTGYYSGHGEYSPIMGNGVYAVSHWSNGDYYQATNNQDDLAKISATLAYLPDDYPAPTDLVLDKMISKPTSNFGRIQNRNDRDTFRVVLNDGGSIKLTVSSPIGAETDLDVLLSLVAEDKSTILATSNPIGDRNGYLDEIVLPGTYYIVVDGGGELGPADGFSDYGSIGYYEIAGFVGNSTPICKFSIENISICTGEELTINNQSFGDDLQYQWTVTDLGTFTDETPNLSFTSGGNKNVELKISNDRGESTCSQVARIGNNNARLVLPKNKLNTALAVNITNSGKSIVSLTYNDFTELNANELYVDLCLVTDCYDIEFTDIFEIVSCAPEWVNKTYATNNTQVMYQGDRYQNKWYVNAGEIPGISSAWQKMTACPITDDQTLIKLTDLADGSRLLQTTPMEVGSDLYLASSFCIGNTFSIKLITLIPNTCDDVIMETNSNIVGTSISWDFGLDATPAIGDGNGAHNIKYSTPGNKTITLTVDGVVETMTIDVLDGSSTPTIQISTPTTTFCPSDEVVFSSYATNGGNAIVDWYVNGTYTSSGNEYTSTNFNNDDKVTAILISDKACVSSTEASSNELTLTVVNNCQTVPVIDLITQNPNNCNDVVLETASTGTSIVWSFGSAATPTTANGPGPHNVAFSTIGNNIVTLTIDEVTATTTVNVTDASTTPTIQINTVNTTVCPDDLITFSSNVTNGGNEIINWYLNGNLASTGNSHSFTNFNDGDKVTATLTSDKSCVTTNQVTSNEIVITLDNNCNNNPVIDVTTQNPDNCNDVVFETASTGTSILWDFGATATPTTANGVGPHNVAFSTVGVNTVTLTIDGVETTKEVNITNAQLTPAISVSTANSTSCKGAEVEFLSKTTNGGSSPTIEWYINNNLIDENTSFSTTELKNDDVVKAILISDATCLTTTSAESTGIVMEIEDCVSGFSTNSNETIHIYPNPVNDRLFIQTDELIEYTIFNSIGTSILSGTYTENGINIAKLKPGIYFVQIDQSITKVVVK